MSTYSSLQYIVAGTFQRDYYITRDERTVTDALGGNVVYAGAGLKMWVPDESPGLLGCVSSDFPQDWINNCKETDLNIEGIRRNKKLFDMRRFRAYNIADNSPTQNPAKIYSKLGKPFPKQLLGYQPEPLKRIEKDALTPASIRLHDIPKDYLAAMAAHICPIDFLTLRLLPAIFRQYGFTTITLEPSDMCMNPHYWNDIPSLITGLTAFISTAQKMTSLFQGRTTDLWEMMDALSIYSVDFIVVNNEEKGYYLLDTSAKKRWIIPRYPSTCIDPTGENDTFAGGFLGGYRKTYDPVEAVLYGNIAASFAVEGVGPFFPLNVLPELPIARIDHIKPFIKSV